MIFSLFLQEQLTNIICSWVLYLAVVFKISVFLKLKDKLDIFLDHILVEEKLYSQVYGSLMLKNPTHLFLDYS